MSEDNRRESDTSVRKRSESRSRDKVIALRVSEAERVEIAAKARDQGYRSVGAFMRAVVLTRESTATETT